MGEKSEKGRGEGTTKHAMEKGKNEGGSCGRKAKKTILGARISDNKVSGGISEKNYENLCSKVTKIRKKTTKSPIKVWRCLGQQTN
ncbi:hypothetical protein [Bartonella sp. CB178]|uniref:hypothetical protein n=1 Tax=Bartonella sp. CB178 TaxID=3112255 RepID=UPI00300DCB55